MKIALVHDFLAEYGGAERVIESLHQLFPNAPLYVAFADLSNFGAKKSAFAHLDLRYTWLQRLPGVSRFRSPLRIFSPRAFRSLDLSAYDVVISSSNAYHSKSVLVPHGRHLCYCHTPPRSLYGLDAASNWKKNFFIRWGGQIFNHFLRQTDFEAAQKIDQIIVNSQTVAQRVKKFWRRDSVVIYPPVALVDRAASRKIKPNTERLYYLFVNRLNFAKHPELAVQACLNLNLPLKVVGTGPMLDDLKKLTANFPQHQIEFLGSIDDNRLISLYAQAKAVLYPVIDEDFGIVPIEAMAFGTPVIAHYSGGPTETIIDHQTGLFFKKLNLQQLEKTILAARKINWQPEKIHLHAQQFSDKSFKNKILTLVKQQLTMPKKA